MQARKLPEVGASCDLTGFRFHTSLYLEVTGRGLVRVRYIGQ